MARNSPSYTYTLADGISGFNTISLSSLNAGAAIGADVISDTGNDTLILSAGPNIALLSDPSTDTITISGQAGGGGGGGGDATKGNISYAQVFDLSGRWESTFENVGDLSGEWESTFQNVRDISGTWNESIGTKSTLKANSALWDSVYSNVNDLSTNFWHGTYSLVNANSGTWNESIGTKSTLKANSALWDSVYSNVNDVSADFWHGTYSLVKANSGTWQEAEGTKSTVKASSASWGASSFKTIAVGGLNAGTGIGANIVADTSTDTLTLCAGPNIAILTDPSTDTITISAEKGVAGGGGSGGDCGNVATLSGDWENTHTIVNTNSADWTYVAENSGVVAAYDTKEIWTTVSTDSDYQDVIGMVHFENTNGATETEDDSFVRRDVNMIGTAQISTAQKKFGSSSLLLDGNSDYASFSNAADLDLGTEDFTIECWFYYDQATAPQYSTIFDRGNGSGNGFSPFWVAVLDDSGLKLVATCGTDGNQTNVIDHYNLATITNNTWHHVALARDGSNFYIYLDGVSLSNAEGSSSAAMTDNDSPVYIGARGQSGTGSYWGGYIDEFRFTKGSCRYTGGTTFTPSTVGFSGETRYQHTVVTGISGTVPLNTGTWNESIGTKSTLKANSALWDSAYSNVNDVSGDYWHGTYSLVNANSGTWQEAEGTKSTLKANSALWDSVYSNVNTLSTNFWHGTYSVVNANSAAWAVDTNTTYTAGDGLTLNTTDFDIDAAQTTITSLLATDIKIGEDDQTKIDFETANQINFYADNAARVNIKSDGLYVDKIRRQSDSSTTTKILLNDEVLKLYAGHSSNNICTIDSTGLTIDNGSLETATIDYTDGDLAMTIADGGKVTFAAGFAVGSDAEGDIVYHNGTSYIRLAKGTDNHVLTMNGNVPNWEAAAGGGGGGDITTDDEWDAKGDLIAGTGSDTADRVAVGTNDHVLLADSSASTGVAWNKSIPLTVVYRGDSSGDYTVAATDDVIIVNDSSAFEAITVTLPAASSSTGRVLYIKMGGDMIAGVTIDGNSSETIDGNATLALSSEGVAIIVCNGTTWYQIGGEFSGF